MKIEGIVRIVAEVMGFIIAIVFTMELMDQEVITPVQEAVQVVQAERSGSSISLLSLWCFLLDECEGGLDMDRNIWLDGMMGLIVGDALGVPVQFMEKEEIVTREVGSVKGMESGGAYNMPAGTWSDDGSMALATLDSIVNNKRSVVTVRQKPIRTTFQEVSLWQRFILQ